MCVCVCVCVCVRVCARARVRAYVHPCVRVYVRAFEEGCVCECVLWGRGIIDTITDVLYSELNVHTFLCKAL